MMNKLLLASLFPAAMMALATSQAAIVTVTDGTGNNFGTTGGVAIDFDTTLGITADWIDNLTTQPYNINSLTLYIAPPDLGGTNNAASPNTATVRLGVYSTLTGTALSGHLGFSNNTVDLTTVTHQTAFTFTFSGMTVTPQANPGLGIDVRYFIFQTDTAIKTDLSQSTAVAIRRIDGDPVAGTPSAGGTFGDELSAILQNNAGGAGGAGVDIRLRTDRAPEYSATITPVPEPTALSLLGIAGLALVSRRRRQS